MDPLMNVQVRLFPYIRHACYEDMLAWQLIPLVTYKRCCHVWQNYGAITEDGDFDSLRMEYR